MYCQLVFSMYGEDMQNSPEIPAHLAYLPDAFAPAIRAAAEALRKEDPALEDDLAVVRVMKDLLTWLQGDKKLDLQGELVTQGRLVRGPSENPKATWAQLAHAMRLSHGQSAYAYLSPRRETRLENMNQALMARRVPAVLADLPGIGVVEAARRLGVTTTTVYARVKRGELAHEYAGETLRITEDIEPQAR